MTKLRRAFKAKVLGHGSLGPTSEVLTFGEMDAPRSLDLSDPFKCLDFVEQQVRQRTRLHGVEDYEVVMNTFGIHEEGGLVSDNDVVRPWRYPNSREKYNKAR